MKITRQPSKKDSQVVMRCTGQSCQQHKKIAWASPQPYNSDGVLRSLPYLDDTDTPVEAFQVLLVACGSNHAHPHCCCCQPVSASVSQHLSNRPSYYTMTDSTTTTATSSTNYRTPGARLHQLSSCRGAPSSPAPPSPPPPPPPPSPPPPPPPPCPSASTV
mgnify:CR=1 FL=1